jgi:hypothetical protein
MIRTPRSFAMAYAVGMAVCYLLGGHWHVFADRVGTGYDCLFGCQETYACGFIDNKGNCFCIAFQDPTCLNCCTSASSSSMCSLPDSTLTCQQNGPVNDPYAQGTTICTCDVCSNVNYQNGGSTLNEVNDSPGINYNLVGTTLLCQQPAGGGSN